MCAPPRFVVILGGVTFWHGPCSQRRANLSQKKIHFFLKKPLTFANFVVHYYIVKQLKLES